MTSYDKFLKIKLETKTGREGELQDVLYWLVDSVINAHYAIDINIDRAINTLEKGN